MLVFSINHFCKKLIINDDHREMHIYSIYGARIIILYLNSVLHVRYVDYDKFIEHYNCSITAISSFCTTHRPVEKRERYSTRGKREERKERNQQNIKRYIARMNDQSKVKLSKRKYNSYCSMLMNSHLTFTFE